MVVEPAQEVGRGLAYAADDLSHLLNVRVGNMSAFPTSRSICWNGCGASASEPSATPRRFASFRGVYGAYLADLVRGIGPAARCVTLRPLIDLAEGVDKVVLTLDWAIPLPRSSPCWRPATMQNALSAVFLPEALVTDDARQDRRRWVRSDHWHRAHNGRPGIVARSARSRRKNQRTVSAGLLPSAHEPTTPFKLSKDVPYGAELSAIAAWIRAVAGEITADGSDWRSAIDALRPHTQRLWRSMSIAQRRRFLRHGRADWDVLRHRMAPEVAARIKALCAADKLEIIAGRIVHAKECKDGIAVQILRRGRGRVEGRKFARLIDCTGLGEDPFQSDNPLIGALLTRGTARTDPLGIGLTLVKSTRCSTNFRDHPVAYEQSVRSLARLFGNAPLFPTSVSNVSTWRKSSREPLRSDVRAHGGAERDETAWAAPARLNFFGAARVPCCFIGNPETTRSSPPRAGKSCKLRFGLVRRGFPDLPAGPSRRQHPWLLPPRLLSGWKPPRPVTSRSVRRGIGVRNMSPPRFGDVGPTIGSALGNCVFGAKPARRRRGQLSLGLCRFAIAIEINMQNPSTV